MYAIMVDGHTEFWYLQMLKRNEQDIRIDIKPEIPQKKKLADQYFKAIELSENYDKVYWIVDMDVLLKETSLTKKGRRKPIDIFLQYKDNIEKKHKKISVIINQPCLEYWFLLHFEFTTKPFSNCDEARKRLMVHLPAYEKTQNYFVKQDHDIYSTLKPNLKSAIDNARKLPPFNIEHANNGISEMAKLFENIGLA